jgi:hypothetical protein
VKPEGVRIRVATAGSVNTDRVTTGRPCRAAPDGIVPDSQDPAALWPDQVFLLSVIAGMAHSTLKCGTATRDGVAFGAQLKVRPPPAVVRPRLPDRKHHGPVMSYPAADVAIQARDPLRMDQWQDSQ